MTESTAVVVRDEGKVAPFRSALEHGENLDRLKQLLPPSMDERRFTSVSLMALTKNPDLLSCDRTSFVMAVLEAAEIGLEPTGGIGGAHLVPFKSKIQLILDYRGVQHLIREGGGGEVKTVLVYEGDEFEVYEGTQPRIEHKPKFDNATPDKITHVYAWPLDHPDKFEVMTRAQVDAIRARAPGANRGPWVTDYGAMARKSVLKRISAWLPLKPSVRAFLDRDTQREIGQPAADEPAAAPVVTRTSEVRDRIRSKSGKRQPAKNGPGAADNPPVADDATSGASAAQRTDDEAVEGEAREVCGAGSDPKLGEVETCVLPPGHLTDLGAPQRHQGKSGAVWPAKRASS